MAASYGYSRVAEQGFMGFDSELREGAWGSITITPKLMSNGMLTVLPRELPVEQFWKLRVGTALVELAQVYHGEDAVTQADRLWDGTQRRFKNQNAVFLDDLDPDKRASAERIRERMMMGEGTEQTKLTYEKEIDFGRSQVFQATQEPLKSDIEKLGMQNLIAEISMRTEALAQARGRNTEGTPQPLSVRIREAKSECVNAFNSIHGDLDFWIGRMADGPGRDRLIAMRAPLLKLLERYPSTTGKPGDAPEEPPAGSTPPVGEK